MYTQGLPMLIYFIGHPHSIVNYNITMALLKLLYREVLALVRKIWITIRGAMPIITRM